jgi:polyphenol oxidase
VGLAARALGADPAQLFQVTQVHGAAVARAEGTPDDLRTREADALVARAAPDAVAVRVADCVPVLVGALDGSSCAAIHAGWRGIVAGVVAAALAELRATGAREFAAAIGPCIGACCFEVGADVAARIAAASCGASVVTRAAGDKAMVDLRSAVRAQLVAAGLEDANVEDVSGCTKCESESFFSFRRDGAAAGRQLGAIRAR